MVDLASATFVHREYLCFLKHPVLAVLREQITHWEAARFGVSVFLNLVAPKVSEVRHVKDEQTTINSPTGTTVRDVVLFEPYLTTRTETNALTISRDDDTVSRSELGFHWILDDERFVAALSVFGGPPRLADKSVDGSKQTKLARNRHLGAC